MRRLTVARVPTHCPSCGSRRVVTETTGNEWGVTASVWRCELCNYSRSVDEGVPPSRLTDGELLAEIEKLENRNGWPLSDDQRALLEHLRAIQESRRSGHA